MSRKSRTSAHSMPAILLGDPWVSQVHRHDYARTQMVFATGHDLFSSAALDVGTSRLLRTLAAKDGPLAKAREVLDLGCGTGILGLSLARGLPEGQVRVTQSDRDRLAVHLSRLNAAANGLGSAPERLTVLDAGPGYAPCRDSGAGPFDLIVQNVPAKAGRSGLRELLFGAGPLLRPGGVVAFVHVAPLTPTIDELREEFAEEHGGLATVKESAGKEHRALHWRFEKGLPLPDHLSPLDPWQREDVEEELHLRGMKPIPHVAVHDVEEFDSEHYRTTLMVRLAERERPVRDGQSDRLLLFNPCHGFLAARFLSERRLSEIALSGRDTLELAVARTNISAVLGQWSLDDCTSLGEATALPSRPWLPAEETPENRGFDLIAGPLLWKEGPAAHAETLTALKNALSTEPKGLLILSVGAGQLDTLRKIALKVGLRCGRELKKKGTAAICLRRR
ncbi:MAG: methyltransferase [Planctomycetota bacterium]